MKNKALIFLTLLMTLTATAAWAQTSIPAGGTEVTWGGNCSESVSFKNDTNRPICDFRIITTSPSGTTVFPGDIVVEDGVGNWTVDDDEDGSLGPAPETDKEDSTPSSPARVQQEPGGAGRPNAGRCIAKDGTFGITLCGDDASTPADEDSNLNGHKFTIKPTSESGSDIVAVAVTPDDQVIDLVNDSSDNPHLTYSVFLVNDLEGCVDSMKVSATDRDVSIVSAKSEPAGAYDPAAGNITFDSPLSLGDGLTLELTLDRLSATRTTKLSVQPLIASTGTDPIPAKYPEGTASDKLVFLGKVMHVGPSPGFWSGGVESMQQVTYEIQQIREGFFNGSHVVVHHTLLQGSPDMERAEAHVDRSVYLPGNLVWIEAELRLDMAYPELGLSKYHGYQSPDADLAATCLPGLRAAIIGTCLTAEPKSALLGALDQLEAARGQGIAPKALQDLPTLVRRAAAESSRLDERKARALTQAVDSCAQALAAEK